MAEFVVAIFRPQLGGFIIEAEGFEVRAGHDGDGFLVELGVALHAGGLEAFTEARVELVEHGEALLHHVGTRITLRILQTRLGIEDGQRREAGGEEAIAGIRLAVHAHTRWERLVAGSEEVLRPGADVRMLDGAALLVAAADQILAAGMHARFRGHAADDGNLVGLLREVLHRATKLKACFGRNGLDRSLRASFLRIERVDVRHAADHLEEDDVFCLPEAWASGFSE